MLVLFRTQWAPDSGPDEYGSVALLGLRYDMSVAAYLVLPCLAASAACLFGDAKWLARLVRAIWAPVVVILTLLIGIIDAVFFAEFHEQFNHFAFGAVQGYLGPVIETAWAEYPLGWLSAGFLVSVALTIWGLRWALRRNWLCRPWVLRATGSPAVRVVLMALFVVGVVFAIRGGFGSRPIQFKDSAATSDTEINKLVPNAVSSLRYAVQQHLRLLSTDGLQIYLDGESITAAAAALVGPPGADTVDQVIRRRAAGPKIARPQHMFLIIMESADAWTMLPQYESLHLSDQMVDLANRGIVADFFMSAGEGSIESVASIVTGLPEVGVTTNYQPNSRSAYSTAIATQMRAIGYKPRFFKGSYLMFQRYGEFAEQQGFEVIEGAEAVRREDTPTNEWGVQDDVLFDHVFGSLEGEQPTFNVIVSTTYHPPYDLDVHALGYPVASAPTDLPEPCETCTPRWLQTVGHAWYADQSLGEFVRSVEREYPDSLFVITGDHWSRRFITNRPPLPLIRETPLILYGPQVLTGLDPAGIYGTHTDIAPTLIELLAPAGHEYHSFGRNMLDAQATQPLSEGSGLVIGPGYVLDLEQDQVHSLEGPVPARDEVEAAKKWTARRSGLAWWRIMQGNELPAQEQPSGIDQQAAIDQP